jgi:N-methylhydantoinase B
MSVQKISKQTVGLDYDPIILEIIRHHLNAIPNQIDKNITRTAFTPLISEYKDYAVGIVDCQGKLISQSKGGLPVFVANALGTAVLDGLGIYGENNLNDGDIVITNHAGTLGQHLNNLVMYTPIRLGTENRLFGFFAIVMHHLDIGGGIVGSCVSTTTTDVFQEGIQFRSVKLWSRGIPVEETYRMIKYNTRFPKLVLGDFESQVTGCLRGRDKVIELIDRYGFSTVQATVKDLWDKSEQIMRKAIQKIPDGIYQAESFLDDDGVQFGKPVRIGVAVRVAGEEITIDFSNVDEQTIGPINAGYQGGAVAAARIACKYLFTPLEPANDGDFRPVHVEIPKGKFLSARPDAPVGHSGVTLPTVIDTIFKAMEHVIPDRISAAHHGAYGVHVFVGRTETGELFQNLMSVMGGWGAGHGRDANIPFRSTVHGDCPEVPVEMQEALYPLQMETITLRQDSGGAGEYRGGLGVEKVYRALTPCQLTVHMDRTECPPWGLKEGKEGKSGFVEIIRSGGEVEKILKANNVVIHPNDLIRICSGGGGGFGNPLHRDPYRVMNDVKEGYVSHKNALTDYGVILDEEGNLYMDETKQLRNQMIEEI